eukprot:gb/GECG01002321.1/.p1 GENE.gb/GECG01002321.1/~~gb/GECG01002321.1/.p1  ORF type:complete len:276 (+),score=15.25 gb/GECG01002321.1/:1-828(+)
MVDLPMRQIEEDNDSLSDSSSTSSSSSIRKSKSSTSTLKQRFAVEQAPSSSSNDNTTQKGEGKAQEGGDGYYKDHHSHKRERKSRNRILADVFIGLWFALITWATTVKSFFGRILFFTTVFFGVNKAAPPLTRMFWPDFDQIPRKQRDRWINISVSLVHSTISGAYCVWTVWRAWNEYTNPDANWVMSPKSRAPLWTISVSVGYFAYDTYVFPSFSLSSTKTKDEWVTNKLGYATSRRTDGIPGPYCAPCRSTLVPWSWSLVRNRHALHCLGPFV